MRKYTKDHEWVEFEGDEAMIGITQYAADQLGDITYVELPSEGTDLIVGDVLGVIESVKAASDVYSPISGTIFKANSELDEDPSIINNSPEEDGWICKLSNTDIAEINDLMEKEAYDAYLVSQNK